MKNKRIKFAVAAIAAALVLLIGASLAYFTDNATGTAQGTAGTVKISLANFNLTNPNGNINNFNPGDGRDITAAITNTGNKSVDVRETFSITMTPANLTEFTATPPTMGWAIYAKSDCTLDSTTGNYVVNQSASPIAAPTITVNSDKSVTATYVVPTDAVLNGTGANREVETNATGTGTDGNIMANEYVLAMMPASDNSYQGATVTLDILAEAKQHRNTAGVTWTSLETVTLTIGSDGTVSAVPNASQAFDGTAVK